MTILFCHEAREYPIRWPRKISIPKFKLAVQVRRAMAIGYSAITTGYSNKIVSADFEYRPLLSLSLNIFKTERESILNMYLILI